MTEDVFSLLAAGRPPGQAIVGFAAEDAEGPIESARGELERKRLDLLVVNGISLPGIGLEVSENATVEARVGPRESGAFAAIAQRLPGNVSRAVWVLAAGVDGRCGSRRGRLPAGWSATARS